MAVGLVTLLGQVVLLRELLVFSFGSELVYLLALGLLMLGTAAGALAGRRSTTPQSSSVRALLLLTALLLPCLVALARALRVLLGATPGAYLPFSRQLLGMALVCLPFGIAGGQLFQRAARVLVARGSTLASAYAIESAGGLIGGALSTVFLAAGVQNLAAALACGLLATLAACLPWRRGRPAWLGPASVCLLSCLGIGLTLSRPADLYLTGLDHPQLIGTADTPYGRATVTGSGGQVVVFENDALAFESQGTSAEEFAHLAALQARKVKTVLVLGGAIEDLVGEVLKHGPVLVTDVELDERLVRLVLPSLPLKSRAILSDPRVKLAYSDPRVFLSSAGRYDLILSGMPEPDSGQANRFFTREFFEACREHLNPGGVLAFRLRSAENLWTPALARRTASICDAAKAVFADVLVLPGTINVILACDGRLVRDPEILVSRFTERGIKARLVSAPYLRYMLTNDRFAEIAGLLARTEAPVNTDARPVCYPFTLLLWLSRFFPSLGLASWPEIGPLSPWPWAGIAAVAVAFVLVRRSQALRRTTLVLLAGFVGMVLEGSIFLAYQTRRGVLYQDLGLLLMLFMAGLAAGSLAVLRGARRGRPGRGSVQVGRHLASGRNGGPRAPVRRCFLERPPRRPLARRAPSRHFWIFHRRPFFLREPAPRRGPGGRRLAPLRRRSFGRLPRLPPRQPFPPPFPGTPRLGASSRPPHSLGLDSGLERERDLVIERSGDHLNS